MKGEDVAQDPGLLLALWGLLGLVLMLAAMLLSGAHVIELFGLSESGAAPWVALAVSAGVGLVLPLVVVDRLCERFVRALQIFCGWNLVLAVVIIAVWPAATRTALMAHGAWPASLGGMSEEGMQRAVDILASPLPEAEAPEQASVAKKETAASTKEIPAPKEALTPKAEPKARPVSSKTPEEPSTHTKTAEPKVKPEQPLASRNSEEKMEDILAAFQQTQNRVEEDFDPEAPFVADHPISTIALSDDGLKLAVGDLEGNVKVWSVKDERLLRDIPSESDKGAEIRILDLRFRGNAASEVAIADLKFNVRVVDVKTGKVTWRMPTLQPELNKGSVDLSADGEWVIAFSDLGKNFKSIRIGTSDFIRWESNTRGYRVCSSRKGRVWLGSNITQEWDIATGKHLRDVDGLSLGMGSGVVSGDGAWAVTRTGNRLSGGKSSPPVGLWDLKRGVFMQHLGERWTPDGMALSNDASRLVVERKGQLEIWNPKVAKIERVISFGRGTSGLLLTISADGSTLAAPWGKFAHRRVRIWSADTGEEFTETPSGELDAVFEAGQRVLTIDEAGQASVLDAQTLKPICVLPVRAVAPLSGMPHGAALSPDGRAVAIKSGAPNKLTIWETQSCTQTQTIPNPPEALYSTSDGFRGLAFPTPDRLLGAWMSEGRKVTLWDTSTGKDLKTWDFKTSEPYRVTISSGGGQLLLNDPDARQRTLYNTRTDQETTLPWMEMEIRKFASFILHPTKPLAVTQSNEEYETEEVVLGVMDIRTNRVMWSQDPSTIQYTTLSTDGERIAVLRLKSSEDPKAGVELVVYDTASGKILTTYAPQKGRLVNATIASDNQSVLVEMNDRKLHRVRIK